MAELKRCPFCGGMVAIYCDGMFWSVECPNPECQAEMSYFNTKDEAIEAWNRRVAE